MIPTISLWRMHCVQTGNSCGVTVPHVLFTDWLFLWCDSECDTCIVHRPVILVVVSWFVVTFLYRILSVWHVHYSDKGDSCGVTVIRASYSSVILEVLVFVFVFVFVFYLFIVAWQWHVHHVDQGFLWRYYSTCIMQTGDSCCASDTRIMQTSDLCGVTITPAWLRQVYLVVWLWISHCSQSSD